MSLIKLNAIVASQPEELSLADDALAGLDQLREKLNVTEQEQVYQKLVVME